MRALRSPITDQGWMQRSGPVFSNHSLPQKNAAQAWVYQSSDRSSNYTVAESRSRANRPKAPAFKLNCRWNHGTAVSHLFANLTSRGLAINSADRHRARYAGWMVVMDRCWLKERARRRV